MREELEFEKRGGVYTLAMFAEYAYSKYPLQDSRISYG